jgi:hypothetical protein
MDTRPGAKPEAFVAELVKRWLRAESERLALRKHGPALRGFQWKNLFLPDGINLDRFGKYAGEIGPASFGGRRF